MRSIYRLLMLGSLMFLSSPLLAQAQSPEEFASAYFDVLGTGGFSATAELVHPDALVEFRDMLLPVYEFSEKAGDTQLMDLTFGAGTTYAEMTALSPLEFYAGFMKVMALQIGDGTLSFDELEVLGTVSEGDARHVLTRITVGAEPLSLTELEVISVKLFEGQWKLQLNGEMRGMAQALRANLPPQ